MSQVPQVPMQPPFLARIARDSASASSTMTSSCFREDRHEDLRRTGSGTR